MKKLISLICVASLLLGLVGCDKQPGNTASNGEYQPPRKTSTYAIVVKD